MRQAESKQRKIIIDFKPFLPLQKHSAHRMQPRAGSRCRRFPALSCEPSQPPR